MCVPDVTQRSVFRPSLWRGGFFVWLFFCLLIPPVLTAQAANLKPVNNAVGEVSGFEMPTPGTYKLMHIMPAGDGLVLDTDGKRKHLSEFTKGKVTVLSFIYSSCSDPAGCPYAYLVFHQLKNRLEQNSHLHGKVRLVSLSFDPKRDTPEVMKLYGSGETDKKKWVEWKFLTTGSVTELLPILDYYGQDVFRVRNPVTKQAVSGFSHNLKVFLIDQNGEVREIYSSAYLKPDMVYNDIITLLMEEKVKLQ
ncbi:hypothetical protein TPL01_32040 [Sulfuriferula plumbiphila]|uniref:Thioredoxin domain-containing protein n=1 Tax=Sulfuriferula plumbiphila TaxID=171865 RepID=A0A512LC65_9PROT|nr:SCO family protein [Sulfuriferula plumbiphila]BBP04206.1 hypothetical protein SFPGR_16280 [Sulfuriferula plumbiphila]GEP32066.1 hypothetical protein TPL01_32040 [Sulfuriferula plumbiphila]